MSIMTAITDRAHRQPGFLERMGMILAASHLETLAGMLERPGVDGQAFLRSLRR